MKIPDAKYTNTANHIFILVFSPITKLPNNTTNNKLRLIITSAREPPLLKANNNKILKMTRVIALPNNNLRSKYFSASLNNLLFNCKPGIKNEIAANNPAATKIALM